MYLERVDDPCDLKKLNPNQLPVLAEEIRDVLIEKCAHMGGHLSSNLGIVEVTIGLHYIFDFPHDKIIFDVSHQCYTHKILTGRKEAYTNPEKYASVCGFTAPAESEYDIFRVGHSSTSISLATGMAKARDLCGGKENIIAVIGDGALSGGEALEGLDFGGAEIAGNLIIVFNDNQMSISENHGGLYKGLQHLRDSEGKAKDNLFRAFGYDYRFVKDGNDVVAVIDALRGVKDIDHPVVVHICTKKGKGYSYAETNPETTHMVSKFDRETGTALNPFKGERYDRIIGDYLLDKMSKDPKVVTLSAAVPMALNFIKEHRLRAGKQFVDVGIAEEHAVTMLAGLSKYGCKPVFATMATFFQRTYDQISQDLCINKIPATLIVVNASVYASTDVTHIGLFDIPLMSNIPNLVYLAPTNKQEYLAMLDWSIEQNQYPVAIRAPRNGVYYSKGKVDKDYSDINKYKVVIEGKKVAILALGDFYQLGEELAGKIKEQFAYNPTLVNPRYITGVDKGFLNELSKRHNLIITLEDGILDGGFGQKIAEFYGTTSIKVVNYGLKKSFLDRYDVESVLKDNHLKPELIIEDVKAFL